MDCLKNCVIITPAKLCNQRKNFSHDVELNNKGILHLRDEAGHSSRHCTVSLYFFCCSLSWLFPLQFSSSSAFLRSLFTQSSHLICGLPPLPFSDLSSHNPPILAVVFLVFSPLFFLLCLSQISLHTILPSYLWSSSSAFLRSLSSHNPPILAVVFLLCLSQISLHTILPS